jgi:hypothetical protein
MIRPVTRIQIDAALRMHCRLEQWRLSDVALHALRDEMPGWNDETSLIKCVAINALYSTNVFAIIKMAKHVTTVFKTAQHLSTDELVAQVALLDLNDGKRPRHHVSFASKLCHFFVDEERFPIYDKAACDTLRSHLDDDYCLDGSKLYPAFRENLRRLKDASNIVATVSEMDRYLWIVGIYMKWQGERSKSKPMVNAELLRTFMHPTSEDKSDLDVLVPDFLKTGM